MDQAVMHSWNDYVAMLLAERWQEAMSVVETVLDRYEGSFNADAEGEVAPYVCALAEATEHVGPYAGHALEVFTQRFPNSLHPAWLFSGLIAVREGRTDDATQLARAYLFVAKCRNAFDTMVDDGAVQQFVTRAFLLATSVYTELGARNRSLQILAEAQRYRLHSVRAREIADEIDNLRTELTEAHHAETDAKWERFFGSGHLDNAVAQTVFSGRYPLFATRIDLLESCFRVGSITAAPIDELYAIDVTAGSGERLFVVDPNSRFPGVVVDSLPGPKPQAPPTRRGSDLPQDPSQPRRRWLRRQA